jgi:hypothetical protein
VIQSIVRFLREAPGLHAKRARAYAIMLAVAMALARTYHWLSLYVVRRILPGWGWLPLIAFPGLLGLFCIVVRRAGAPAGISFGAAVS